MVICTDLPPSMQMRSRAMPASLSTRTESGHTHLKQLTHTVDKNIASKQAKCHCVHHNHKIFNYYLMDELGAYSIHFQHCCRLQGGKFIMWSREKGRKRERKTCVNPYIHLINLPWTRKFTQLVRQFFGMSDC